MRGEQCCAVQSGEGLTGLCIQRREVGHKRWQRIRLSPTRAGKHRSKEPKAHDAPTIKPDHPMVADHDFTKASCCECGCGLPCASKSGNMVIIRAGSFRSKPRFGKAASVFLSQRARWAPSVIATEDFDHFPSYLSN